MSFVKEEYYREELSGLALDKEVITSRLFEECRFSACSFVDCKFEKCRFLNCKFTSCILSAISPVDCRFIEVEFQQSKVIGIDWTRAARAEDLVFIGCQINYSNFKMLKLPKIKITGCEAKEVDFIETDLTGGDFRNTDFASSRFFKTNLSEADFRGAKNYFIDTRNNILKKARFSLPEVLTLLSSLDIVIE
jgi:fluoroquinolone resistance protein